MTEADSKDGLASGQFADILLGVCDRFRVAGAVREKNAVGIEREHVFRGSLRRNHSDTAALLCQHTENILLDAEIIGDDVQVGCRLGSWGFVVFLNFQLPERVW